MNEKNKSSKIMKKALAATLACTTLPGANIMCSKNIASAWFWNQKQNHTQEEIDSIYEDANNNLNKCMDSAKKLDDIKKAQSFIKNVLDLQDRYNDISKTYEKAVGLQKEVKELQGEIDVCVNLQEIELRKATEEAEKEALRIEDEHRRKLEEQRLQMEKEERARQDEINNAKASLSEKLFSMSRKARKDIELDENAEHINQLSDEIETKILSIDNINRVEAVENLINELQTEIENILNKEAQIRQENFEKTLKQSDLINDEYHLLREKWDDYAKDWQKSIFYSESVDDAVGDHLLTGLSLPMLSAYKIYGFGDYFLLRDCISSRDQDICSFEERSLYNTYQLELNNRLAAIDAVSKDDALALKALSDKWQIYYDELDKYLKSLVDTHKIPAWRAYMVKGVAAIMQTNAILNAPYYKEELPDISLDSFDGDVQE